MTAGGDYTGIEISKEQVIRSQTVIDRISEFQRQWNVYFANHPEVVASWGHQNGYMPSCGCKKCEESGL